MSEGLKGPLELQYIPLERSSISSTASSTGQIQTVFSPAFVRTHHPLFTRVRSVKLNPKMTTFQSEADLRQSSFTQFKRPGTNPVIFVLATFYVSH